MAAIFVPSGDHAGPQPPRESIDSMRHRRVPLVRAAARRHRQHLIGAFAETAAERRDPGERHPLAVGRPGRRAGLRQLSWIFVTRAGRDVEDRHLGARATCRRR